MSATLGEGGDLERITGRKHITRLQIPNGWDKQGIGRRFFLFPGRSLQGDDIPKLISAMINFMKKSLVIDTNERNAKRIREFIKERLQFETFDVRQIETSKAPFVSAPNAVAVVANRYDGIDFPDDECRFLIIQGLPKATNLQENFF